MIRSLAYFIARALRRSAGIIERVGNTQKIAIERTMSVHDMVSRPDERYYGEQYWHWIAPLLEEYYPERRARALDIGCGQGRLTLPLAAWLSSGTVVGIDLTAAAIDQARLYASQQGLTNLEFQRTDALEYADSLPGGSLDLALMLEVSFFMPSYKEVIAAAGRALRKGGLFVISFRSQYFDLLYSVHKRDWSSARLVRDAREGQWGGGSQWFSWHTIDDINALLTAAGFSVLHYRGIGIASGMDGDPLSLIAQPSKLTADDQAELMDVEISLAEEYAECGRYTLAVALKA